MQKFKKILRTCFLILMVFLASFGLGFVNVFAPQRERYMDKPVTIEVVDKREEEELKEGEQVIQ